MTFKKSIGLVHLWLGLISGLLVFIIAITGCLYAFKDEIQNLSQPYRFVEAQDNDFLLPSQLVEIARHELPGKHIHAVLYTSKTHAAKAIFYQGGDKGYYQFVYMNPYTGAVLKVTDESSGFFDFILDGHFYLWLPEKIGQPVVAITTLVFLAMVISGIILWWPRNKNGRKQRFKIKWDARWRRKNYDLHNVLGFYASWIAIIFVITGLVWGFEWFWKSYYYVASGGESPKEYYDPQSDSTAQAVRVENPIDEVYVYMKQNYPADHELEIHIPENASGAIAANANPNPGTYWKIDYRYFDQYNLKELNVDHMWGRYANTSGAQKLMRMNYDIHVGAILGLPGKILAFCASLIIASLPITGFLIWYGRRNKEKKNSNVETQNPKDKNPNSNVKIPN